MLAVVMFAMVESDAFGVAAVIVEDGEGGAVSATGWKKSDVKQVMIVLPVGTLYRPLCSPVLSFLTGKLKSFVRCT